MTLEDAINLVLEGQDPREVMEFIITDVGRSTSRKPGNKQNTMPKTPSNNMDVPEKSPRMKSTDDLSYGLSVNKEKLQDIAPPQDIANQGGTTFPYGRKHPD